MSSDFGSRREAALRTAAIAAVRRRHRACSEQRPVRGFAAAAAIAYGDPNEIV